MNPDDETELHRLTSAVRAVAETVGANPEQVEALRKAAIALILTFLRGDREEVEAWCSEADSSLTDEVETTVRDALFRLQDPEFVASELAKRPELKAQIKAGSFPAGSAGEVMKEALAEARRRTEAGNVAPLRKPGEDDAT